MKTRSGFLLALGGLLLLVAAFLLSSAPALADLPAETCSFAGGTRTCDLWATTGTVVMPDGISVPIWGFAATPGISATLPGPTIVANQTETLKVVLHNTLPQTVSLVFPGQVGILPDVTGVAQGGVVTYTMTLTNPGTFLYEAGLTPNGARQVAMGLYGALVVRPLAGPGQAYDATSAYDYEALLVLGDIDPALNADPAGFMSAEYEPRYRLINGLAYPNTVEITATAGVTVDKVVLLRFVNAGLETHNMGLLGLQQEVIAEDGKLQPAYKVVTEKIATGETMDSLVRIPAGTQVGTRFLVYDTTLLMHNADQRLVPSGPLAFGGMMTFIRVTAGAAPGAVGPLVSNVQVSPSNTTGVGGVVLSAAVGPGATGAEWFTNTVGAVGTGTSMTPGGPGMTATIDEATLANWPAGFVIFYVRATDGTNWGPVGSVVLNLDKEGPANHGMSLFRDPTNGTRNVLLRATGDDHSSGRNAVNAAEWRIAAGAWFSMTLARVDNPITAMTSTIPAGTINALPEGLHLVEVHSRDSLGTWGAPGVITMTVDKTGPGAPAVILTPNVLDMTQPPAVTAVRLDANLLDAMSNLANAEAFIGLVGAPGTGFDLYPSDGLFDEPDEAAYFELPLATFLQMPQGFHTVSVRGLDVAGNWGALGEAQIEIKRGGVEGDGPVVSNVVVTPPATGGASQVTLTADAEDVGLLSNVIRAEWFVGSDPGVGNGYPMQAVDGAFDETIEALTVIINVSAWQNGNHTLSVRAQDANFNWGAPAPVGLQVTGNAQLLILADNFNAGLGAWNVVGGINATAAAAIGPERDALGLEATIVGADPAYVSFLMPPGELAYRASFYFHPNGTVMGTQHHDIFAGLHRQTPIFGVQVEAGEVAGDYEVRGWVLDNGVPLSTAWYDIGNEAHQLAVRWRAGSHARFSFLVDGQVMEELVDVDTSAYRLHEIRLGPSANLDAAASGAEYFDTFISQRSLILYLPTVMRTP